MNAPASVFEHAGKQYVVALSAGNALAGTAHGDSVWLFGLDGKLPPAQARDSEAPPAATAAAPATAANTANTSKVSGAEIFQQACVPCHGPDGKGGHGGGAPLNKVTDLAAVALTITEGRKTMPAFGGALTAEQIQAVSSYIVKDLFK
jgi:alcohol dehydrogenase (cytochrome c)